MKNVKREWKMEYRGWRISPPALLFSILYLLSSLPLSAAPQAVYVNPDGSIVNTTDFRFKAHKIQICDSAGANCTAIDTDLDGKQPLDSDLTAIAGVSTTAFGRNALALVDAPAFRTYIGAGTSSFDGVFASLTGKPTTIGGYGITDFNSLGDARWSLLAHTHTFASLTSKPATIAGYGITDFNSLGDARWQPLNSNLTIYAGITPSANVQTLLGAATFAAFRTSLGVAIGTDVQAYDADLTTWAGITPSANAQTLVTHTFAQMRSDLGLVIGTNVQAWDADLDAIAALAGTSGFLKKTGANTWALDTNTYLTGNQSIFITGDASGSGTTAITLTLSNIPTGTTIAGSLLAAAIAAPSTPAAGKGSIYLDSTSKNIAVKDDAGVVKHGVQTKTAVANNFATAINDAGQVTVAQPAFTDISGTLGVTQGGNGLTSAALGDLRYGSGTNTLAILAGNTTTTKKYLSQTGNGSVSAVPAWAQIAFGDLSGSVAASQMPALTGDVTTSAGAVATTIATNAVTNAKAAQMAANTVKGNNTGSTANAGDLTVSQTQTLLQISPSNKQTTTLGSAAASVTFTVPSGYTNLRVILQGRSSGAVVSAKVNLTFNSDSGSNYDWSMLYSSGTTTGAVDNSAQTSAASGQIPGTSTTASYPGSCRITVANYAGTTFYKSIDSEGGDAAGGIAGEVLNFHGTWKNTAAITSLTLTSATGNFVAGTVATLIAE